MEGAGGSCSCATRLARSWTPNCALLAYHPRLKQSCEALCLELLATVSPGPIKRKSTWLFSQERCFAGFTAETQAPIMMAHQTKLSPTACTAVLQFGHEACDAFLRNRCKLPESHLNVYRSNDIGDGQLPGRARSAAVSKRPVPSPAATQSGSLASNGPDRPSASTYLRSDGYSLVEARGTRDNQHDQGDRTGPDGMNVCAGLSARNEMGFGDVRPRL